jgi:hypothetical protein
MKKFIAPMLILLISCGADAQETHLDQFYRKYNSGGAESSVGSINLSLLLNISSPDSTDGWWHRVSMCRFLTIDKEKTPRAGQEWDELTQSLRDDHFEEWMSVRHGKENIRLMAKDRKDGQEEVVCVAIDQHGSGVFIHLRGRFSAADKARIEAAVQDRQD